MALLTVYKFPHPVLKRTAQPVTRFDADLGRLAADMLETMVAEDGIGLAAVQVGQLKRLVVTDVFEHGEGEAERPRPHDPRVWVNPEIRERSGETVTEEGCLSVVDFRAEIRRAARITLAYQTLAGELRTEELEGLTAVCLQHEIDHLNGVLFIDHLPPLKRQIVRKRLAKLRSA